MYTLATGTELVFLAISLGAAAVTFIITRPSSPKGSEFNPDKVQTTKSLRGDFLQYVIGRRSVSPYFVWAGDRQTVPITSARGGKGGASSSPSGVTYTESACHALALGPVDKLFWIRQEGKIIWQGNLSRFTTPSGSRITVAGEGSFEIYWGELDQPVCSHLAAASRIGLESSYPYHCYIVWINKTLGSSARWPQLEYEIEASTYGSLLTSSPRTFSDRPGINPAHIFYQLTTGLWPHGCAMDTQLLDFGELEVLGALFQDEGLAMNLLIKDGKSAEEVLAILMVDAGFVIPQIGLRIVPIAIRVPSSWPIFDKTHLTNPLPAVEIVQGDTQVDRVLYAFSDYKANYTEQTIQVDEDGEVAMRSNRKPNTIDLTTVTDVVVAKKIADRRQSEQFIQGSKFDLEMMYSARMLYPGMVFEVEGFSRLRVASIIVNTEDNKIGVKATLDQFGSYTGFDPTTIPPGGETLGPAPDLYSRLFEVPYGWDKTASIGFILLRIRANTSIGGAQVLVSADNTTFYNGGTQTAWCRGGTLVTAIEIEDPDWIEASVIIDEFNADMSTALDLSADVTSWFAGRQLALIGDELLYLQSVTALGDGKWQLNGLIRNVLGTAKSYHAEGTPVYIFEKARQTVVSDAAFLAGGMIYYKSQPAGTSAEVIPSQALEVTGYANAPYCPTAIVQSWYHQGLDDFRIMVIPRVRNGLGKAANEQVFGRAVAGTTPTTWYEGSDDTVLKCRIKALDGTLKRIITRTSAASVNPAPLGNILYTDYLDSERVTDGLDGQDFILEIAMTVNEVESPYQPFIIRSL